MLMKKVSLIIQFSMTKTIKFSIGGPGEANQLGSDTALSVS